MTVVILLFVPPIIAGNAGHKWGKVKENASIDDLREYSEQWGARINPNIDADLAVLEDLYYTADWQMTFWIWSLVTPMLCLVMLLSSCCCG